MKNFYWTYIDNIWTTIDADSSGMKIHCPNCATQIADDGVLFSSIGVVENGYWIWRKSCQICYIPLKMIRKKR